MILPNDGSAVHRRAEAIAYMRRTIATAEFLMANARPGTPLYNIGKMAFDQLSATLEDIEEHGEPVSTFTHELPT